MGKPITSPVEMWPGTVILYDPITIPMAIALEDAQHDAQDLMSEALKKANLKDMPDSQEDIEKALKKGFRFSLRKRNQLLWPAIRSCIEKWDIQGLDFPSDVSFPATPKESSQELLLWLYGEVTAMFEEPEEEKNE